MDAIAHAATRRLDSSLHAVGTPTPAIPVESVRTLSVTADYRLSEVGRKASLLNGGNGRAEQRVKVAVPLTRLHLVHVDDERRGKAEASPAVQDERGPARHQDQARARLRPPANASTNSSRMPRAIMNSSARITRSGRPRRPPGARRSTNGGIRWRWSSSAIRIGGPSSIHLRRSAAARS